MTKSRRGKLYIDDSDWGLEANLTAFLPSRIGCAIIRSGWDGNAYETGIASTGSFDCSNQFRGRTVVA